MIDNCPICKKSWKYTDIHYCERCDLYAGINYIKIEKEYILGNNHYSENAFEKMLKLKAFW
jgi:hypothetical protein